MSGRVAYVVGAAGGLGAGVARAFAQAGWTLGLGGRTLGPLEALAASLAPATAVAAAFDALDAEGLGQAFQGWRASVGPPDACLCLVGGYLGGRTADQWTANDWRAQLEVNLQGPALVLGQAFGVMRESRRPGLLVAISALAGLESPAGKLPYGVAKAGVLHLVRGLGEEGAPLGIRALALVPRVIDTPTNRAAMPSADRAAWADPAAIGRMLVEICGESGAAFGGGIVKV